VRERNLREVHSRIDNCRTEPLFVSLGRLYPGQRRKLINQRMDQLAREVGTLKPGDPRRERLVSKIFRLNDLLLTK